LGLSRDVTVCFHAAANFSQSSPGDQMQRTRMGLKAARKMDTHFSRQAFKNNINWQISFGNLS